MDERRPHLQPEQEEKQMQHEREMAESHIQMAESHIQMQHERKMAESHIQFWLAWTCLELGAVPGTLSHSLVREDSTVSTNQSQDSSSLSGEQTNRVVPVD